MDKGIPAACTLLSLVYFVGVAIIWFAPETKGKPQPESERLARFARTPTL